MKFNIVPKNMDENAGKFHEEQIFKIFYLKGKRIPFMRQKTLANCGPLSIVNGSLALKEINKNFNLPSNFPQIPQKIRKFLSENQNLRETPFGIASSIEIGKNDYTLEGGHIVNLIKKTLAESNIIITGDRFSGSVPVRDLEVGEKIRNSDWLICNKDFHYISLIKLDDNDWVFSDSMSNQPCVVNQKFIEDNYFQKGNMNPFISMKVKDKIVIIKK